MKNLRPIEGQVDTLKRAIFFIRLHQKNPATLSLEIDLQQVANSHVLMPLIIADS